MPRPRKSISLHIAQGTYQPSRHAGRNDFELSGGISANPPTWLSEEAQQKYIEITQDPKYGKVLAGVDGSMVILFCNLWGRFVDGVKDPANRLTSTETMVMVNLGAKLGLNPCDRTKLKMPEPEKAISPWAGFRTGPIPLPTTNL